MQNLRLPPARSILASLAALALAAGCSGGEIECVTGPVAPPSDLCAPADAPANTPLTVRARELCGGCMQNATGCEITREGGTLTLQMIGNNCTLPDDLACTTACSLNEVACQTPPLPAGSYTVEGLSEAATSTVPVVIEVGAGGDETDCTL